MTDILARVIWNRSTGRWRNLATGRFVSNGSVRSEVNRHIDAAQDNLQRLTQNMYSGNVTLAQWQSGVALELKDGHLAQSMFAVGGRGNMTQANFGRVGGTLANEYSFLSRFADDIAAGRVSEAQALARVSQYGNATGQSYWREWQRQQDSIELEGLHRLTRVPQDGSTICRGNCRCFLSVNDNGSVDWVITAAESCATCLDMEGGNPWRPML